MPLFLKVTDCNETDIRLVDGQTTDDGRVEICLEGLWGSVLDDFWDTRDATVVCRQLGYNGCEFQYLNRSALQHRPMFNFSITSFTKI